MPEALNAVCELDGIAQRYRTEALACDSVACWAPHGPEQQPRADATVIPATFLLVSVEVS